MYFNSMSKLIKTAKQEPSHLAYLAPNSTELYYAISQKFSAGGNNKSVVEVKINVSTGFLEAKLKHFLEDSPPSPLGA